VVVEDANVDFAVRLGWSRPNCYYTRVRLLPLLFVLLLSCKPSGQGPPGASLVRVDTEAAGPNCAAGGVSIRAGLDADHNGSLSLAEVQSIHYVCNGASGESAALMKEVAEDAVVRALHDVAIRRDNNGALNWNESAAPTAAPTDASTEVADADDATYEELMRRAQEALVRADIDEVMSLGLRAHSIKKDPESAYLLAVAACHKRDLERVLGLKPLLDSRSFRKLKKTCESLGFPLPERGINPCLRNPDLPKCKLK
jgi:hypothetical protein